MKSESHGFDAIPFDSFSSPTNSLKSIYGCPSSKYKLRSVVCYYGAHYMAFAREGHEGDAWTYFDDRLSRVVGPWKSVVEYCTKGKLQPVVLLFERG